MENNMSTCISLFLDIFVAWLNAAKPQICPKRDYKQIHVVAYSWKDMLNTIFYPKRNVFNVFLRSTSLEILHSLHFWHKYSYANQSNGTVMRDYFTSACVFCFYFQSIYIQTLLGKLCMSPISTCLCIMYPSFLATCHFWCIIHELVIHWLKSDHPVIQ